MKVNDVDTFGRMLRERRKELGHTQAYVSDFTGYSTSFLSDVENGKATCEIGKCIYLANILGLDVQLTTRGNKHE